MFVGLALEPSQPLTAAKVVDASGALVPNGTVGELWLRGRAVTTGGYWLQPSVTAAAVDARGWLHTGDAAVLDDGGYTSILGRIRDVVVRGRGAPPILAPAVERSILLLGEPSLRDCAVVGVPHPDRPREQQVAAWLEVDAALLDADAAALVSRPRQHLQSTLAMETAST